MTIPTSPDTKLRRKPAAEALTEAGFPTSPNTLATMVTRGGGPPFYVFGKIAMYHVGRSADVGTVPRELSRHRSRDHPAPSCSLKRQTPPVRHTLIGLVKVSALPGTNDLTPRPAACKRIAVRIPERDRACPLSHTTTADPGC